jgi:hypothetical protein
MVCYARRAAVAQAPSGMVAGAQRRCDLGVARVGESFRWAGQICTMSFLKYSNIFQIDLIIRWSSIAQQILNKIWISRELNKEQHSLLKLFSKFRIQFELKIREPL